MIELKSPAEIERMRVAGGFIATVLGELAKLAEPGVNLLDLEHRTRELIRERGAESCYWDYAPSFGNGPFRNVICLSVNDAVLHGLPHDYVLRDGDVLSMDIAVSIDGWVADSARTVIVGTPADEDVRLVRATEEALAAGINAAQPDNRLGDISAAIGAVAADYGYPVNTEFGGHGLGRTMHEEPHVPQPRPRRPGPQAAAGHDAGAGTLVRPHHRPHRLRPRRLDDPLRGRLPHGPLRAHGGHHRGRPPRAHRGAVTPTA
ncbi:hypothetical protein GCM10018954_062940 [Kutzneria kofuensis]